MIALKIISIFVALAGAIIFGIGLYIFLAGTPPYGVSSVMIMISILLLLGSIIMLCVSEGYYVT